MPRPKKKPPSNTNRVQAVVGAAAHRNPKKAPKEARLDKQRAFARLLFAGEHTVPGAWRQIYEADTHKKKASETVARANAFRLKRGKPVQEELDRLQKLHAERLAKEEADRQEAARIAEETAIATRDEVLKFHTAIMRCPSNALTAENADLVLVVETKRLAPPKYDKEGNEIPHPDADADGYVTDVTRRPPDIKERQKSAEQLSNMQGWNKGDPNLKQVGDTLTDLLLEIRGGGKA